jgi:hypothetical protein
MISKRKSILPCMKVNFPLLVIQNLRTFGIINLREVGSTPYALVNSK